MDDRSRCTWRPLKSLLSLLIVSLFLVGCGGSSNGNGDGDTNDAPGDESSGSEAQTIFVETGCAECHGEQGEGIEGEGGSLQGTRMILDQFETRVRNGRGQAMPGYTEEEISDEQIAVLHEWLRTQ